MSPAIRQFRLQAIQTDRDLTLDLYEVDPVLGEEYLTTVMLQKVVDVATVLKQALLPAGAGA